jgi:hypothetical protein
MGIVIIGVSYSKEVLRKGSLLQRGFLVGKFFVGVVIMGVSFSKRVLPMGQVFGRIKLQNK